jgi:hypothetical protein
MGSIFHNFLPTTTWTTKKYVCWKFIVLAIWTIWIILRTQSPGNIWAGCTHSRVWLGMSVCTAEYDSECLHAQLSMAQNVCTRSWVWLRMSAHTAEYGSAELWMSALLTLVSVWVKGSCGSCWHARPCRHLTTGQTFFFFFPPYDLC